MSEEKEGRPKADEWYLSSDGEYYESAAYASEDEAIDAGVAMYWEIAEGKREWNDLYRDGKDGWDAVAPTFYVGKREWWWPSVDEDDIIYQVQSEAGDYAGEFAEGWLDVSGEQREKLRGMLQDAFDRWVVETGNEPTFFMICGSKEVDPRDYAAEPDEGCPTTCETSAKEAGR